MAMVPKETVGRPIGEILFVTEQ